MKPQNFPARKLARQLKATGIVLYSKEAVRLLKIAREKRTKKNRG